MTTQENLRVRMNTNPSDVSIFSNGCTLIPYQLHNGKWGWVVSTFEDDCFYDGEYVEVNESWSEDRNNLIGFNEE